MALVAGGWTRDTSSYSGRIVFAAGRPGSGTDVFVVNPDGTHLRRLTSAGVAQSPTWSPDGTSIVYVNTKKNAIVRIGADGSHPKVLVREAPATQIISDPVWSPDGKTLAFVSARSGTLALWTYSRADGALTQLTQTFGVFPTWSPDSRKIAYGTAQGIAVIAASGGGDGTLITGPQSDNETPVWSPNGTWIAVRQYQATGDSLAVMQADGNGQRILVTGGVIFPVAWSPSSNAILFFRKASSSPTAPSALYIVALNGGTPHMVRSTGNALGYGSWHR